MPRLEPHSFVVNNSALLKPGTAFKIYASSLEPVRISTVGDKNFFAAQKAWRLLIQDFPVQKKYGRRLLAPAFSGSALSVFEGIASSNLYCETEELWDLARDRLCNSSHQRQIRTMFNKMTWREGREDLNQFAHRLQAAALALA